MKIIYVHCGGETNIRDPRSYKNKTELVVENKTWQKFRPVRNWTAVNVVVYGLPSKKYILSQFLVFSIGKYFDELWHILTIPQGESKIQTMSKNT